MKNRFLFSTILSAFALTSFASAQTPTSSGTLGVNATVQGSISMIFSTDASGVTVTNTGTSTAALPLGTVQMYGGTVPTNVVKTLNTNQSFQLATPFDVTVNVANSPSTSYSLGASLNQSDAVDTWAVNGVLISNGAPAVIASSGDYGSAIPYAFNVTVPASAAAGSINNVMNFTVTAN